MNKTSQRAISVRARIDRLPSSRYFVGLVARVAAGGWFAFFQLFMAGFISLGFVHSGIYTVANKGLLDTKSFACFLASFFLGMFLSTAAFGFISDKFGRRSTFTYSIVAFSIAEFAIAFLSDPVLIDLARLIAGFAVGVQVINNDSYVTELTPSSKRGHYLAASYIVTLTSIPVASGLSALLVPLHPFGIDGWRIVVAIGAAGGLVVWFLQQGLPKSPRWLEAQGRLTEADAVVSMMEQRIGAELGRALPPPQVDVPDTAAKAGHWREMFSKFYLPRTLTLSIFQFAQSIAVFGFTAFIPVLLEQRGFTFIHSLNYSMVIALLAPVGAACGTYFSERVERKWQLVFTALLIGASGAVFASANNVPVIVGAGSLIALGNNWMISVFHPYAAELFPTRIRSSTNGFTFSWSRVSSILVGYWVGDLLVAYGVGAVFVMIGAAMLSIIISVGVFGPATNGRRLETLSP